MVLSPLANTSTFTLLGSRYRGRVTSASSNGDVDQSARTPTSVNLPMTREVTVRGSCPHCETTIDARHVLIEYQTDAGPAAYAECPECRDVVNPA